MAGMEMQHSLQVLHVKAKEGLSSPELPDKASVSGSRATAMAFQEQHKRRKDIDLDFCSVPYPQKNSQSFKLHVRRDSPKHEQQMRWLNQALMIDLQNLITILASIPATSG